MSRIIILFIKLINQLILIISYNKSRKLKIFILHDIFVHTLAIEKENVPSFIMNNDRRQLFIYILLDT